MEKKLTTEQIAYIDETLVLNGLNFDDLKIEATDHIASEIEVLMKENTLSFEENLHTVFNRWKPQLRPVFSALIGFTNPRIMTLKCHKIVKKQLFAVIGIAASITSILMIFIKNLGNETALANYKLIIRTISLAEFVLVILAWILILKSKRQTTYSYMIKKKMFGVIIFLFTIGIGLFPIHFNHQDLKIVFVSNFFALAYILSVGFYLQLACKHLQFDKKLT